MVMKSAMGLCRALVHPPIVLGLLADGYRLTVVSRAPSESEDPVTELPDSFDFNLTDLMNILRLRRCIRNLWDIAREIIELDTAAHSEVENNAGKAHIWGKACYVY
ncbi:hypothetical protein ARMSODRAFT_168383 [Armillaria solidipes]|uniref:Uncharacterized protein n=1 Tax=Armillaria solidipes TaxID=1076256 RepID=A0A2H3BFB4_9AGAR|nr:hypothetical protein ARMSODRAFT_168383 [Armillaria solidipes]